jgi:hypothetical protein
MHPGGGLSTTSPEAEVSRRRLSALGVSLSPSLGGMAALLRVSNAVFWPVWGLSFILVGSLGIGLASFISESPAFLALGFIAGSGSWFAVPRVWQRFQQEAWARLVTRAEADPLLGGVGFSTSAAMPSLSALPGLVQHVIPAPTVRLVPVRPVRMGDLDAPDFDDDDDNDGNDDHHA